jgi:cell division septum initiation protein DivIVA
MALADIDIFATSELDGILTPHFDRALNGVNAEQVARYVARVAGSIGQLRTELDEVRAELEVTRQRYETVRDEAYAAVTNRMTELMRSANEDADRFRKEAQEAAYRTTARARAKAERIRREAERLADRFRNQAEKARGRSDSETDRIIDAFSDQRDAMLAGIRSLRGRLAGLLDQVDSLVSNSEELQTASDQDEKRLPEKAPPAARRGILSDGGQPGGASPGRGAPF